jgi:hypothetical protein
MPASRTIISVGLLLLGVQVCLLTDFWLYRPAWMIAWYVAAAVVCFVPAVQRAFGVAQAWLNEPRAVRTAGVAIVVGVVASFALYVTAVASDRQFMPVIHDEFSYLIQTQTLATGRLWMPAHPLRAFFDTFYLITDRAYASQYFPGAAMMFVPGVWLGLPAWVMPLAIAGAAVAMLYLVLREVVGSLAGVGGAVVAIGSVGFRFVSIMSIAQVPALLLMLLTLWTILRWQATRRVGWAIAAGTAMGWLAITRPLDAAIVGAIGAGFVAWWLRRESWRTWRRVGLAGLLPLLPFLALQLTINKGVTGEFFQTPFRYYADRDMPGSSLGFHDFDATRRPVSPLPQKQAFYDTHVVQMTRDHTPAKVLSRWAKQRWRYVLTEPLPDMLLILTVPLGIAAIVGHSRALLVVLIAPVWCAAYSLHTFTYFHYYTSLIPAMLVLMYAGMARLDELGPWLARARPALGVMLPVTITVLAMPQFRRDVRDQVVPNTTEATLRQAIAGQIAEPRAIVLVRFGEGAHPESEVVYNVESAWPDDARVIRAHDLGDERSRELFNYYSKTQPERMVYRFERPADTLTRLGRVDELAGLR